MLGSDLLGLQGEAVAGTKRAPEARGLSLLLELERKQPFLNLIWFSFQNSLQRCGVSAKRSGQARANKYNRSGA